jgi:hypothetical protein
VKLQAGPFWQGFGNRLNRIQTVFVQFDLKNLFAVSRQNEPVFEF